ncbi:MAG: transposase [Clostridiales bacterium]|jgi:hypothetical protein|nr:transposase [Clostridiales bacterium]
MRLPYPSDISRERFEPIRERLESVKKKSTDFDLYDAFCAVLYIIKEGVSWPSLPHDFPTWREVYAYYSAWTSRVGGEPSILEKAIQSLPESERKDMHKRLRRRR